MSGIFSSGNAALGNAISAAFERVKAPQEAGYVPVSPQATQATAISGDQSASTALDQLLGQSNSFQQQQATSLMNQALPGYSAFAQNLTNTASSLAADPYAIPSSVTGQLSQYAAENNINEGTGASSGFSGSNTLRSLGINALQYGQSNMAAASNALQTLSNTAPRTSPMSPLSFMVTPAQQQSDQTYTNTLQQQIQQGANNATTAAQNWNTTNMYDNITSSLTNAGSSLDGMLQMFMGGGMGGGMGGSGGGGGATGLM